MYLCVCTVLHELREQPQQHRHTSADESERELQLLVSTASYVAAVAAVVQEQPQQLCRSSCSSCAGAVAAVVQEQLQLLVSSAGYVAAVAAVAAVVQEQLQQLCRSSRSNNPLRHSVVQY
jgi:fatty acid/phospholipid biosynthesis enzyme